MYKDEDIYKVIKLLQEGVGDDAQLAYWLEHELKGLEIVFEIIFHSDEGTAPPEEILRIARERNKPIIL